MVKIDLVVPSPFIFFTIDSRLELEIVIPEMSVTVEIGNWIKSVVNGCQILCRTQFKKIRNILTGKGVTFIFTRSSFFLQIFAPPSPFVKLFAISIATDFICFLHNFFPRYLYLKNRW